jgi:glycogen operon protein
VSFFKKAVKFTKDYSILQRRKFFLGNDHDTDNIPDISWYGKNQYKPNWGDPEQRTLCVMLDGGEVKSAQGDYCLFIILNADFNSQSIGIPALAGKRWFRAIDTSLKAGSEILDMGHEVPLDPSGYYIANPRSTVVLVGR